MLRYDMVLLTYASTSLHYQILLGLPLRYRDIIKNLLCIGTNPNGMINIERIYNNPRGNTDNFRILVDRLWPRGLSKDRVKIDLWQKDIAPSDSLRKWFAHDEKKWDQFKSKYFKELEKKHETVNAIIKKAKENKSITLLYGTKEERFNNAVALKEYLENQIDCHL